MLTVDANVFVSAASTTEMQYGVSTAFFGRVLSLSMPLYCPTILVPEAAAGIARPTNNVTLAGRATNSIIRFSGMNLVEIDENRALLAAAVSITHRLRGADAIYVAIAQEFGTTLITWDGEMLTRGA